MAAAFFERFRAEVRRYTEGVHRLGPPASAGDVKGLPDELASFLRSWNGADLFVDAYTIYDGASCHDQGALLVFGETAAGDRLAIDRDGAVVKLEEDTGEALIEGTSFARWVEGVVVADGVLYDREGEFKDDVFDESGEEMRAEAVEKRERKALRVDPGAPAPAWRLARALEKTGRARRALELLEELVAGAPRFGWAWFDLGRLRRAAGRLDEAQQAFASAADADPSYEHAGYFAAHAARVAAARGDEEARSRWAKRALELDPGVARAQKEAARTLLAEGGERAAALEAAEVAAAVAPKDLEVLELLRRLRASPAP